MVRQLREREARADTKAFAVRRGKLSEFRQLAQADDHLRLELPPLHVRVKVRAARDEHGVGAIFLEQAVGFAQVLGRQICERRQAQHQTSLYIEFHQQHIVVHIVHTHLLHHASRLLEAAGQVQAIGWRGNGIDLERNFAQALHPSRTGQRLLHQRAAEVPPAEVSLHVHPPDMRDMRVLAAIAI